MPSDTVCVCAMHARLLPKFHCKLNGIERVWGQAKRATRSSCDYSMASVRSAVRPALDSVSLDFIRRSFPKSRDYATHLDVFSIIAFFLIYPTLVDRTVDSRKLLCEVYSFLAMF